MSKHEPTEGISAVFVSDDFFIAEILAEHRWPEGFVCRGCGGSKACHLKSRPKVWECRCGCQTSVTAGTALHGTRLPLGHVLLAAVLQARDESISANALRKILGVRYETAWKLLHRLRHALLVPVEPPAEAADVTVCRVRTRKHTQELPWRAGRTVQVLGVMDVLHRIRATLSDRDREVPFQALVDALPNGEPIRFVHRFATWLWPLQDLLSRTYRQVSLRWLRRYVAAWAWGQGREAPIQDLLTQLMRAPPAPWAQVKIAPLLLAIYT